MIAATAFSERDAAARNDALLEGRPGGLQRVLDAVLLLLHLRLGGGADLDDGDAARELRQALLSFSRSKSESVFSISAFSCLIRALIPLGVAGSVDDRGRVLVDHDLAGLPELR